MAKPPSYIDKVNYIVDFFEDPCDAPWTVYVETAGPVLGEMVMHLIEGGFTDFARAALRPKGAHKYRSRRHTRAGRRGSRSGGGLGNPVERAGKSVKVSNPFGASTADGGLKHLWQIDNIGQRALWYWLVADVLLDGTYLWTSLIQESEFCSNKAKGAVTWGPTNAGVLGLPGWQGQIIWGIKPDPLPFGWNCGPGWAENANRGFSIAVWATAHNQGQIPTSVRFGFWVKNSITDEPDIQGGTTTLGPFETGTVFAKASVPKGTGAIFAERTFGGNVGLTNLRASAV